jgi:glutaconate CoA-transferase subunit A
MRTSVRHANSSLVASASDMPRSVQLTLSEAIATQVHDGDVVALEGFTHLIPFAAGHEIIRQGRRDLTVVRMTPDVVYDQLIGMGCVARMIFSYGGNPGVGSLHRMRDAVEKGWPRQLALVEHSHAGLANAYVAGASKLPFAVLKGYAGTDLEERGQQSGAIAFVECPFTGQRLSAVRAINPDVTVIHAQQADREGNVMLWGLTGVQKEAVLAADRAIVTVEEIVDELEPRPHAVVLPSWVVTAVCHVPNGAWPSYAHDYSKRDNRFYAEWDEIARDRDRFRSWMEEHVLAAAGDAAGVGGEA